MTIFLVIQMIPGEAKCHLTSFFNQFSFNMNEQTQTIPLMCLIKKRLVIYFPALLTEVNGKITI